MKFRFALLVAALALALIIALLISGTITAN